MTVVITGWRSRIAEEFRSLMPAGEPVVWGRPCEIENLPPADRYLMCHGLLRSKTLEDQTQNERAEGWLVNFTSIVSQCDWIFEGNPNARVCVIGSESGYRGSFDEVYATSKAAVHAYVEKKRLPSPDQQLVAISPGVIEDCGMTARRVDVKSLDRRRQEHPKHRFVAAREVAMMAHHLLYHQPYVSGTVIRMHGGLK